MCAPIGGRNDYCMGGLDHTNFDDGAASRELNWFGAVCAA